ncbi:Oidioi.mRNA.OKI2018_I69.chr2.g6407.t1.cds [Oikopleura dioica]|uniref:Oidioi.mRNA.OKI2018_I69.chr2.g6407.t1.cds n=1 Tax=Oikopleura dioica TaxID=34765 RepID=A0ABN7T7R6_OIKDI|nr:Oidioi.mRNA.OKI2018_I69.chr2.g6407.t1.cds [Oikopleura dioica]
MNAISIGGMFRTGLTLVIVILLPLLYIIKVKLEDSVESQTAFISEAGDLVPRHRQNHGQPHQDPLAKDNHCHPMAEKIIFLKTHKTASSTVQNVLLRWGQKNKKTFALPKSGKSIFSYWKSFKVSDVHGYCESCPKPDIIAHHLRYSPDVEKLFAMDEPVYHLSIIRNPTSMFESVFNYMKGVAPQFKTAGTLEKFLDDPHKYIKHSKQMTSFFSRNHLTYEFGFDPMEEEPKKIAENLKLISQKWNLIMITEHMAESLAVLKHDLCLSIEDIACFITNARPKKTELSKKTQEKLLEWNQADARLYDHFNRTLWRRISHIGEEKIAHDVEKMHTLIDQLTEKCVDGYLPNSQLHPDFRTYQPPGLIVKGIQLTEEGFKDPLCYQMAMSELPWTRELMKAQGIPTNKLDKY